MALDRVLGDANLYIGGLFTLRAKEALRNANVTHVVSALRLPLDEKLFRDYRHHVVEVDDVEDENILEFFPGANEFLREGLEGGGGCLVHCAMGKSRSATLLIAYLLATRPDLTPPTALALLRQSHPLAEPNPGFMSQLELYSSMSPHPATSAALHAHPLYQRWLNRREVDASVACGVAPEVGEMRFGDERKKSEEEEEEEGGARPTPVEGEEKHAGVEWRCRRCRTSLATSAYLIPHTPRPPSSPKNLTSSSSPTTPISSLATVSPPQQPPKCAHIFLDPLSWMRPELERANLAGRLECPNPKCAQNVGKYAWQGMRCSCGEWVVPGICLARGRVDEVGGGGLREVPGLGGGGRL